MPNGSSILSHSFRDPSGFLFTSNGILLRQVNLNYKDHYDHFMSSGLRTELESRELIIPFAELDFDSSKHESAYKILKPTKIEFVSFPYEWCFSELKDAALVLLEIQDLALDYGMILKDANGFNIQFYSGEPRLVDTLSFEILEPNRPWVALRQFSEHFLAPLALMSYVDVRLHRLMREYLDGIPISLASKLLPKLSWLNSGLLFYLHLHNLVDNKPSLEPVSTKKSFRFGAHKGLVGHLRRTIRGLHLKNNYKTWSDYYSKNLKESQYFTAKTRVVEKYLEVAKPKYAWDIGGNIGYFSELLAEKSISTILFDADPYSVESSYLQSKQKKNSHLLPLVIDFNNPSPSLGWATREWPSLFERKKPDLVLSLAIIHHFVVGNNISIGQLAAFYKEMTKWLIVEFVPKSDPNVAEMLRHRQDIFGQYSQNEFEFQFQKYFKVVKSDLLKPTERRMYLMRKRSEDR